MAFVTITHPPSREVYEKVITAVDLPGNPPPGLLVHAAAEDEAGVTVVNVWESRKLAEDFRRTRFIPARRSAGVTESPRSAQRLEPFNVWLRQ